MDNAKRNIRALQISRRAWWPSYSSRVLFIVLTCALSSHLGAAIRLPYQEHRVVDSKGDYYVVLRKIGGWSGRLSSGPVTFAYGKRLEGTAPVTNESNRFREPANPRVAFRQGDTLICRGKLERAPSRLLVSSSGLGFVTLGEYTGIGDPNRPNAITIVSPAGKILHRFSMKDLFPHHVVHHFSHTSGGIHWLDGAWIDESKKELVVLGTSHGYDGPIPLALCVVHLESGKLQIVGKKVLVRALSECYPRR